jgi:putative ABC transport system permease protein
MTVTEMFRVAFHGLAANKLRAFLTMLGVIIGVSAVIVMMALGQGAAAATEAAIRKLGTNRLHVRAENQQRGGVNLGAESGNSLTLDDAEALRREGRLIVAVAPEYDADDIRLKYGNRNTVCDVNGATPEYFQVRSLTIEHGRLFTKDEVERQARVIVLGHDAALTLFGDVSPLGKQMRVGTQPFEVVGVLKKQGAMPFANRDDEVTIPISTAMRRLFRADRNRVRGISVQAVSPDRMKEAEEEVLAILRKAHKLGPDDPPDVRVSNQADLMESANEQGTFLTMLLTGIAAVSLVVGGIGIMNIMLVSVTERTREIGIRKAIGAKRKHILYQFLIEAVTLSLLGGLIGIALGIGISLWMGAPADEGGFGFPMLLTPVPMIVSFVFSALVGVFFGLYPAVKASGLDPIEALRYE